MEEESSEFLCDISMVNKKSVYFEIFHKEHSFPSSTAKEEWSMRHSS